MRSPHRLPLFKTYRVQTALGIAAGAALAAVLAPVLLFILAVMLQVFAYSRAWP